jgi:hypothetical protein
VLVQHVGLAVVARLARRGEHPAPGVQPLAQAAQPIRQRVRTGAVLLLG